MFERLAKVEEKVSRLDEKVDEIALDVKSLLASRSYTRGMVKMASIVGGLVGAAVTAILAYLKGH